MRTRVTSIALLTAVSSFAWSAPGRAATFNVDPDEGRNGFTAIFDSAVGERITAVSSTVGCTLSVDETKLEGRATCSVPLTSIRVDNDDTKSDHFRQWATNLKSEPAKCKLEVEVSHVKLPSPVEPKKPIEFTSEGKFRICGRERDDHRPERIQGTIVYLPAGMRGDMRGLRVRARIENLDREK